MTNHTLYHRLLPVVRRIRFRRTLVTLAIIWFCFAAIIGILYYLNQNQQIDIRNLWLPMILVVTFASVIGALIARRGNDFDQVVHDLEKQFPDLDSTLLTAVEQRSEPGVPLGFLQQDVLRRAVNHSFANPWTSLIPGWQLFAAPVVGVLGLAALSSALGLMIYRAQPPQLDPAILFSEVVVENVDFEITVEPGNAEVERGNSLLVLARFGESIPPEAVLVYSDDAGEELRQPMKKSLDDPVFGSRIGSVSKPVKYWIEFAEQKSDEFEVAVFDYPDLVRTDAKLDFPDYTKLADKVVQDVRRLSAVEGTDIEFSFYVNKSLAEATLIPFGPNKESPLAPISLQKSLTDARKLTTNLKLLDSAKYELKLVDADGRENRVPPKLILNMLKNQLPDLKLTTPRRDVQVSAIEELELAATAWDDFGINSLGVNFSIAGMASNELVLLENASAKKKHSVDHLLEFEALEAQPDQLLSYYFWAEDVGPDGQPRRVESDMYFAEVRHFEEIFRQGQAPPGGQQPSPQQGQNAQNAQQAQQLAELQKQIINATWKLIRQEFQPDVSPGFPEDTQLLVDSQAAALKQLEEMAEEVEDPASRSFVDAAASHMNEAIIHLKEAKTSSTADSLKSALSSEQAAYQGLLKLRAREHEVVRAQQNQRGQQSQQGNNRSQQQLEQLNLKEDENRYENERTEADPQQSAEQREDRQVLSRLRELARRQDDLNDRIKELQSALEKAETPEAKEEIERRLKSLRDQQEQLLRDTDELLDRMQQPDNQQRMAEESQQLEQARENIRESSEALEKGQVSRAAADGTRAQRELEDLRDEFQTRTAGQFNEQMRQMRNEAQELEQKQEEIGDALKENLANQNRPAQTPSLRPDETTPNLKQQLSAQQERVENLRQNMRQTIEEAESYEPLLAEQLYDTYRKSEQSRPDRALQSANESYQRGWSDDAQLEERRAQKGIEQMREGIEQAAESVLGDETESLRIAQSTLRELNEQLQQDMNRGRGENVNRDVERRNGQTEQTQEQDGQNQNGRGANGPGRDDPDRTNENPDGQQSGNRNQQSDQQSNQGEQAENRPPGDNQASGSSQSNPSPGESENQNRENQPGGQAGGGNPNEQDQGDQQRVGQPSESQPQGGGREPNGQRENQSGNQRGDFAEGPGNRRGGLDLITGGGNQRTTERVFGTDFRDWSDRLRDVEEMMVDPDLRSEAARIRDEAKQIRREATRHSAEPNWDLVKLKVAQPLAELQVRVSEELLRRTSRDARVPLDRDPVPAEYQEAVRRYYERIGSGQ